MRHKIHELLNVSILNTFLKNCYHLPVESGLIDNKQLVTNKIITMVQKFMHNEFIRACSSIGFVVYKMKVSRIADDSLIETKKGLAFFGSVFSPKRRSHLLPAGHRLCFFSN